MNHDDPKLTAYALRELPPEDRAAIEAMLKDQPSMAEEVRETAETAGMMRQLFRAELTETLPTRRRELIFQAARDAQRTAGAHALVAPPSNVITPSPQWWRRSGTWQAAAACAVFGFGVYAISITLTERNKGTQPLAQNPPMNVGIAGLAQDTVANAAPVPGEAGPAALQPGKAATQVAAVNPSVPKILPTPQATDLSQPLTLPDKPSMPRKATVIGSNPDPARAFFPSEAASIGVRGKPVPKADPTRPGQPVYGASNPGEKLVLPTDQGEITLSASDASRYYATHDFLTARWQEASSVQEGNTYADLARYFRRDGGSSPKDGHRFVMIRCPFIKVDVSFAAGDEKPGQWPVPPDTRIQSISRPYFEPEQGK